MCCIYVFGCKSRLVSLLSEESANELAESEEDEEAVEIDGDGSGGGVELLSGVLEILVLDDVQSAVDEIEASNDGDGAEEDQEEVGEVAEDEIALENDEGAAEDVEGGGIVVGFALGGEGVDGESDAETEEEGDDIDNDLLVLGGEIPEPARVDIGDGPCEANGEDEEDSERGRALLEGLSGEGGDDEEDADDEGSDGDFVPVGLEVREVVVIV